MEASPSARAHFRTGAALGASALAMCLCICPARAGTGDIVTQVDCPALSADVKAELEARAQVDLTLRSAGGGDLRVICQELSANLVWRPREGGSFERAVSAAATPAALVDMLLVAVAEVAEDAAAAGASAKRVVDGSNGGTPPNAVPPPETKPAQDPASSRSAAEDVGASGSRRGVSIPLGASIGGQLALFGTGAGTVGPSIALLVGLPAGFVASAAGDYGWGFGSGNVVSVRSAGVTLLLSNWFGKNRAFEVGAGAGAGAIMANAAAGYTPTSNSEAYFGAVVRARYALGLGGWRFAGGPEIRLHAPRSVDVDGNKVWEMPVVAAGVSLEAAASIYGSPW